MPEYTIFPSISRTEERDVDADVALARGECPWCGERFDNVAAHASQTHEEEWDEYRGGG